MAYEAVLAEDEDDVIIYDEQNTSGDALLAERRSSKRSAGQQTPPRPLRPLLLLAPAVIILLVLFKTFPGLARHSGVSPRPTEGLRPNGAAYAAAIGPWASTGESWAPTEGDPRLEVGMMSNGTHQYNKTVLLISLDGVRADYLTRGLTPNLWTIAEKGIRAEYMESIFPTLTFPNHWSILTGLYAESHKIIANDFYDPSTKKDFSYIDPARSWAPEWWGGEPIWATAERQGVKSAVLMWPGPPILADRLQPSRWYAFENMYHWSKKTSLIEGWLDLPLASRPQFIAAYLPEVDQDAHRTGPDSTETKDRLRYVDDFVRSIYNALEARNLLDIVDVFFVSDHGMTETSNDRLIYLDDLLGDDFGRIAWQDGWPSAGLRFDELVDTGRILEHLELQADASDGAFQVYTSETMPSEWHFRHDVNDRIAPIYVVPANGWSITNHAEMAVMNESYAPIGNHGTDPTHPDMRAIFVAHGPWAKKANELSDNGVMPGFRNVELYGLFATLLGLAAAPTNGTEGFWSQLL